MSAKAKPSPTRKPQKKKMSKKDSSAASHAEESAEFSPTTHCDFLDRFPGEVRNRIYAFTFCDLTTQLESIKYPPLLQTCRQIRREAMAAFFAEATFHAYVGYDYANWLRKVIGLPYWHRPQGPFSGTLSLNAFDRSFLKKARGGDAVFRSVVFRPYEGSVKRLVHSSVSRRFRLYKRTTSCSVDIRYVGGGITGLQVSKLNHGSRNQHLIEAMQRPMDAVEKGAKAIVATDGFQGFTLTDLEVMAKCFCSRPAKESKRDHGLRDPKQRICYTE